MKKKLIVAISIVAVFALSIAAFAYTRTASSSSTASCCTGDSCPMKSKKSEGAKHASCCDDCNCCGKDGKAKAESCPMKKHADKKAETTVAEHAEHKNVVVATGESCCGCSCCGGEKKKAATEGV